jgi:NAD(P)-dependent dehydrogenase (short-subunit alcohol dehydrogenase family)
MQLDLADLNSVSQFAKRFQNQPIDCLVCNAGVQESINGLGGKEANAIVYRTKQDFEITVGTNHIGHFLLLKLLLKNVKASNSGRIVLVGSGVHDPESGGG